MVGNLGFIRGHSSVLDEVWSDTSCPSQSPAEAGRRMMGIMQHWQAEDDKPDNRRHKCQTALAYYEQMWLLRKYTWRAVVMETRSLTHTSRAWINVFVWKHCKNPGKASTAVFIDNWKSPDGYSLCCHAESLIFEARSEFRVCVAGWTNDFSHMSPFDRDLHLRLVPTDVHYIDFSVKIFSEAIQDHWALDQLHIGTITTRHILPSSHTGSHPIGDIFVDSSCML